MKSGPKYFFLHLFSVVMLYMAAANFLTLIFQYINALVPDALSQINYANRYSSELIRFGVASIIVVYPAFIWVSWMLKKAYNQDSEVKEMKIRKWLIYFTLFAAGLIIVGDVIGIIWNFLGGETTLRFILKALSVLVVSGVIFWHYLNEIKDSEKFRKICAIVVSIAVLCLVVASFFIIGSPQKERLRRFDQQRVSDLQNMQSQIINYWQRKEKLPENLSEIEDNISGYRIPQDPETKTQYEYAKTGDDSFELCATFKLDNVSDRIETMATKPLYIGENLQNWNHGSGRVCFERKIDKDLYPFIKKPID